MYCSKYPKNISIATCNEWKWEQHIAHLEEFDTSTTGRNPMIVNNFKYGNNIWNEMEY